ncbi:class II aaRS and biotin synthetase [Suillus fuscotomentosus]|uniref:Class II aaRS and biotin synthetase n=1 Tax=Suillus fuscotomentosus TaxID=1912939 RepID=A0AAD4E8B7_9AGAM|nr:class II aaRS and biotin synthetase [Suillus fuscotomentosus]KAG1901415.1 class II aaRS and biotin synthetase [Suillus fuscotomentosus]
MNVLVYPSTHPAAPSLVETLASILTPHYLPQLLIPSQLSVQEYPWHTSCALLLLLSPPTDHAAVRKYIESGGRILAFGVGVRKGTLFGPNHDFGSLSAGLGLGMVKDTTILRVADGNASFYISFSTASGTNADVLIDDTVLSVSRLPMCPLDLEAHIIGRYVEGNAPAGILSQSGLVAMWNCTPPLPDILLSQSLSALGLHFSSQRADSSLEPHILPQFLLARPDSWQVHDESKAKWEPFVFEDTNDNFHFHFPSIPPEARNTDHPILELIPPNFLSNPKVKHVLVPSRPLTIEDERIYTPQFSPSAFFRAIDKFRSGMKDTSQGTNQDSWRIGEALMYGEVVSSTQTMFDKNPSFLRVLPPPIVSLATVQLAGRGRGGNAWLSPAGCLQMSLKIRIGLKGSSLGSEWAHKVRLKWPNDIYGLFPSSQHSPVSNSKSTPEPRKIGGVLINTSFGGGVADVVIGSGLNVLNAPPIASLAQLASTPIPGLSVERVAAAVLTSFERMWNSFLQNQEQGFHPFMDQYLRSWLHSDQLVTLTNRTPHQSVRIVGITPDHGLLRTVPMGGGEFIDLQPDGNSFDMMKGLISTKKR